MRPENLKKVIDSYNCLLKEYKKLTTIVEKLKLLDLHHNELQGLQGGEYNEYYHLTKEELDTLHSLPNKITAIEDSIGQLNSTTISAIQGDIATIQGQIIDLQNSLNNKVDVEVGKGLSTNDFTDHYKQQLDNLQIPDISGKLDKGSYTGNAGDLKALIDTKVNSEAGKTLTSNDYSNEEKNKVSELGKKVVKTIAITGDINKRLTLTFEDGTTLFSDFIDKDTLPPGVVPDVMLNSIEFDKQTGIFTGVRSDGQRLTVNLDGRFALLDHNHDDRYYQKSEVNNKLNTKVDNTDPRLSDSRNAKDVPDWAKQPAKPTYNFTEITNLVQELTKYLQDAPKDNKNYVRNNGIWKVFNGWEFRELGLENLNDIKTPGFYGKYNSAEATVARNYPYNGVRGGHLLVLPMTLGSNLTIFQVYFSAGTLNSGEFTNEARIFMRAFVNNSQWLEWREFDGGKVHNVVENVLNLGSAYKDFPANNSTFILNSNNNIQVNISAGHYTCKIVKNSNAPINITGAGGVSIVGDTQSPAPLGTIFHIVVKGNTAFINYDKPTANIDNNIGVWQ